MIPLQFRNALKLMKNKLTNSNEISHFNFAHKEKQRNPILTNVFLFD